MATNTNTNSSINQSTAEKVLSTDIYEISDFIDVIRQNNVDDISETASIVGIFGYMNDIFSQSLQNTLISVSETSNETIATRAKFAKNVMNHAMNLMISKITATPATMTVMIYLPLSYVESNFQDLDNDTGKAKFILDKNIPINMDKYEFHLDYDVILTRTKLHTGKYQYSAMYDLFQNNSNKLKQVNPISDITNPYITTLVNYVIDDVEYLAFSARIHQVRNVYITKNILTNNPIENKALTFEFNNQLAAFDLDITENNVTTHIVPVYSGLVSYSIDNSKWCYYEYLNENTIRIKFDRDSYMPGSNAKVTINIKETDGVSGNITYNNKFKSSLRSEKYNNYNGMYMIVYPLQNGLSVGGKDKKSIKDLKKIIPREASSRGSIINTTDLQNYFNSINDDNCRLYFYKKRDNPFERLYYANLLMKKDSYVFPTNTISLKLRQSDFKGNSKNNNLSINPGTVFYYYDHGTDEDNDYATITPPEYNYIDEDHGYNMTLNADGDLKRVFEYISPFLISIDDDLVSSYLLTVMDENKTFKFDSVNTESDLQFVATNMDWKRNFTYKYIDEYGNKKTGIYDNKYTMTVNMAQNNNSDYGVIKYHYDADNNIVFDDIRVKMIMVLYTDESATTPYRYIEAQLTEYDPSTFVYTYEFLLYTDDLMDLNNRINIMGVFNTKPEEFQKITNKETAHGYFNKNTYAKIFILADFGTKVGDIINNDVITEETAKVVLYGENGNRAELEAIVPVKDDIIDEFLKNNIYAYDDEDNVINVVSIMRSNSDYLNMVKEYNGDELETEIAIMRYIRNNKTSDFIQNTLLKDPDSIKVINSYNCEDLSRYTLCNTFTIDDGINFYHDYSNMMGSVINVAQVQETNENGDLLYKEIKRSDSLGNEYFECIPIFKVNDSGTFLYDYTIRRMPVIKNNYLNTEEKMQDFIYDLEVRRKYINECLNVLEDTFKIDLKFFNTYGPSKMFYYNNPNATSYKAIVAIDELAVYRSTVDEDIESNIVGKLYYNDKINIQKIKGQWGYITSPFTGWVKTSCITKQIQYIDNIALNMRFSLEAQTSGDKYITTNIVRDIKEYIEDINSINELHIPNVITLITNNYRDQLVYFEYLGLNDYDASCQHLYMRQDIDIETCPEFINVANDSDGNPEVNITVY